MRSHEQQPIPKPTATDVFARRIGRFGVTHRFQYLDVS
jgi:hypothetical protein